MRLTWKIIETWRKSGNGKRKATMVPSTPQTPKTHQWDPWQNNEKRAVSCSKNLFQKRKKKKGRRRKKERSVKKIEKNKKKLGEKKKDQKKWLNKILSFFFWHWCSTLWEQTTLTFNWVPSDKRELQPYNLPIVRILPHFKFFDLVEL
jgi:hypothetical protein